MTPQTDGNGHSEAPRAEQRRDARRLSLCPMTLTAACRFVEEHHRHNRPPRLALFAVGCLCGDQVVAVAIVGRPVARRLEDGRTCEILRLCSDGTSNACSLLYGACRRAAQALGYGRVITYTLASEPGTSLKASGWQRVAELPAAPGWHRPSRPRLDVDLFGNRLRPDGQAKVRWEVLL